jgi:hypothetical protein
MSNESAMRDLFDRWERVWHEGQYDLIPSCVALDWHYRWLLRTSVAAVLLLGALFGQRFWWVNVAVSFAVGVFVVVYVIADPRYKSTGAST